MKSSELNGVWGEKLFESEDKKKSYEQSYRVFRSPMLLVLFAQKVHEKSYLTNNF